MGDTLIYSNGIVKDSLVLKSIDSHWEIYDDKNHFHWILYTLYDIENKNAPKYYEASFHNGSESIGIYFNIFNGHLNYDNNKSSKLILNNKTYDNVYLINADYTDTSKLSVKSVYFTYRYLVIRYINNSNDTFSLIN